MPIPPVNVRGTTPPELVAGVARLREQNGIAGDFPADVLADAEQSAQQTQQGKDFTALEFVTIDPPPSLDLDQAMLIQREGDGYVVYYAIDDLAAWVRPGGPMDVESHRRGQTCYLPDERIGLYPPRIAEDAASLLAAPPPRPAVIWTIHLDHDGAVTSSGCERGLIQSRAKLNYPDVQRQIDAGQAAETLMLLREVGELRLAQEAKRGGVSLPIPEQSIESDGNGDWTLAYEAPLPVENWNAQISLLTGICAAELMIAHKVGLLRTLPPADPQSLQRLRRLAHAMNIPWPDQMSYPDFVRSLDPAQPAHLAMLTNCTRLFRGAGYVAFHGELPGGDLQHSALATPYAHTTAPLRRLVDRYVLEICVALCAGQPVPDWVLSALDALPQQMTDSDRREKKFERGVIDLVEALVLSSDVGQTFTGVVTDIDAGKHVGQVIVTTPAVEGTFHGDAEVGQVVTVTLTAVDVATGSTTFTLTAPKA